MRATRALRFWIPGSANVPEAVRLITPYGVTGRPVTSVEDALDWVDGETAVYVGEACAVFSREDVAMRDGAAGRLTRLLDNLEQRGCELGSKTVSKAISLYNNYRATPAALRLYHKYSKYGSDRAVFTALAQLHAGNGDLKALRALLVKLQGLGEPPSLYIFHALLRAFATTRNEAAAFNTIQALAATPLMPTPHTVHLLMACCRSYARGREVLDTVREGRWGEGVVIDGAMYNCLIACCAFRGEVPAAREALDEMEREGFPPKNFAFNAYVNVCRKARNLDAMVDAFRLIRRKNHQPDQVFYSTFVTGIAEGMAEIPKREHAKWIDIAEAAFAQAFEDGVVDSNLHFTALAKCYALVGDCAKMDALRERLHTEGFQVYDEFIRVSAECYRREHAFSTMWAPLDTSQPHTLFRKGGNGEVVAAGHIAQRDGAAPGGSEHTANAHGGGHHASTTHDGNTTERPGRAGGGGAEGRGAAPPPSSSSPEQEDWYVLLLDQAVALDAVDDLKAASATAHRDRADDRRLRMPSREEPATPQTTRRTPPGRVNIMSTHDHKARR